MVLIKTIDYRLYVDAPIVTTVARENQSLIQEKCHGSIESLCGSESERRRPDQGLQSHSGCLQDEAQGRSGLSGSCRPLRSRILHRSEEHTSELQSHFHLLY